MQLLFPFQTVVRCCALLGVLAFAACKDQPAQLYPSGAPDEVVEACAVTIRTCTACHDHERIVSARYTPAEWSVTVDRMRRYPGSGISPADLEVVMRCLTYHAN